MLIQMVETELENRKQEGVNKGQFKGQSHFFGCLSLTSFLIQMHNIMFGLDEPNPLKENIMFMIGFSQFLLTVL